MAKTTFQSVDEYIAKQPEAMQPILARVRSTVRRAVPKAEEVISYQIPAYRLPEGIVLYFAGWKKHYSLYPIIGRVAKAFQEELSWYDRSKGTVRFPMSEPVPVKLIARIAKFRAKEVSERKA